jgi:transcriptional regulator with XRE-family HTH domain
MELKDWLRSKRKEKKLTQSKLAKLLGVSRQTLNYWEAGKAATFSVKQLRQIHKTLGCPCKDVFEVT